MFEIIVHILNNAIDYPKGKIIYDYSIENITFNFNDDFNINSDSYEALKALIKQSQFVIVNQKQFIVLPKRPNLCPLCAK